jgi:hypothetical protein
MQKVLFFISLNIFETISWKLCDVNYYLYDFLNLIDNIYFMSSNVISPVTSAERTRAGVGKFISP